MSAGLARINVGQQTSLCLPLKSDAVAEFRTLSIA